MAAALVALVAGQTVMVLIMTMTPVHMTTHGHHVETVGFVISGHTFGMFALAPLSGRMTERFGTGRVIAAGLAVLIGASLLSAIAPPEGGVLLFLALFLLGYGWNLGFVAGSTMLTQGVDVADRTRLQGVTEFVDLEQCRGGESRLRRRARRGELHRAIAPGCGPDRRAALVVRHPNPPVGDGVGLGSTYSVSITKLSIVRRSISGSNPAIQMTQPRRPCTIE